MEGMSMGGAKGYNIKGPAKVGKEKMMMPNMPPKMMSGNKKMGMGAEGKMGNDCLKSVGAL